MINRDNLNDFINKDISNDFFILYGNTELVLVKLIPSSVVEKQDAIEFRITGQQLKPLENVEAWLESEGNDNTKLADVDTSSSLAWKFTTDLSTYSIGNYTIIITQGEKTLKRFSFSITKELPVVSKITPADYDIRTQQKFVVSGKNLSQTINPRIRIRTSSSMISKGCEIENDTLTFSLNENDIKEQGVYTVEFYSNTTTEQYGTLEINAYKSEIIVNKLTPDTYSIDRTEQFIVSGLNLEKASEPTANFLGIEKPCGKTNDTWTFNISEGEITEEGEVEIVFKDLETGENYGALMLTATVGVKQEFKFDIEIEGGTTFTLPDCHNIADNNFWLVSWGDGSEEELVLIKQGVVNEATHTYLSSGEYTITIRPYSETINGYDPDATAWLTRFGCDNNEYQATSREMITNINTPLTWQMTRNNIDEVVDDEYCGMFKGCSNLNFETTSSFNLPTDITIAGNNFATSMFEDCVNLSMLPSNFTSPQNLITVGENYLTKMFRGCDSLVEINDFTFSWILKGVQPKNAFFETFKNCSNLTGSIRFIINGNEDPNSPRDTFTDCVEMNDYDQFTKTNWTNGKALFSFDISTENNKTFILPDCSRYYSTTANYWLVDWGDGNKEYVEIEKNKINQTSHEYDENKTYTITIRPADSETHEYKENATAWLTRFGCYNGSVSATSRKMLLTINSPLTWEMTRSSKGNAPDSEFYSMFDDCSNLNFSSTSSFNLPTDISTVGEDFARGMFGGCVNLTTLPDSFNLSQGISGEVEDGFAKNMFYNCSNLTTLPDGFTFPQGISGEIGGGFAELMFCDCTSLTTLSDNFNFPQNITTAGKNFASSMFSSCTSLETLSNVFTFPQGIETAGNSFANSMFYNCSSLTTLSDSFTFPQNLTSAGDNFANSMFRSCSNLTTLPDNFNLPQNLTSAGDEFCCKAFMSCERLLSLPSNFNFPLKLTTVGDDWCDSTFWYCNKLATLPAGLSLPQNLTRIGGSFLYNTFCNCSKITDLPSRFKFPTLIKSSSTVDNPFEMTFAGAVSLRSSIKNVIGDNLEPSSSKETFFNCVYMSDYATYKNTNWVK